MNHTFVKFFLAFAILLLLVPSGMAQSRNSKIAFNKALHQFNLEQYSQSITHLKTAVESTPDFIEAYRLMANCYDKMDDLDNAIDSYQKVLDIDPNQAKVLYNMSRLQISNKDYDAAEKSLQTAVNISPNYALATNKLNKLRAYRAGEEALATTGTISKENGQVQVAPERETFVAPAADWGEETEAIAGPTGAEMSLFWASPDPLDTDFSAYRINEKSLALKLETISTEVLNATHFYIFIDDDIHPVKKKKLSISEPVSQGNKHIQTFEYRLDLPKGKHKIKVEISVGDDNVTTQELTVIRA